ncbi:hypothetical protein WICMUC_000522 [Wickerhamomyces mucosus]|uniref:DNA repair protein RAD50 n=1 Tax=Wickerhamomyces mucosus TaxID=1378264 RepID=A0A9P8TIZ6_9ASCO|nr:hypothetical protein WICMUC_000522 [Wickerhamomyces mucosus]
MRLCHRYTNPYDAETIEFGKPLTLIVGSNGVGKTTVIECLKYATTGDLPPNSKGGAFVHDPHMMDDKVVKAEVKLAFRSVAGDSMICTRTMQMSLKKTTATFKSLEGQLLMKRGDIRTTISTKCSELDDQVPLALGVPRAILDYVIFCHQEESLWPLSEPSILKKRFDDIFQASQFTKALDQIKATRKDMATEIKLLEQSVGHLKQDKDRAERTEDKLQTSEKRIQQYQIETDILREELADVTKHSDDLFKSNQEFQEVLSSLERMKNSERSLIDQIVRLQDGTNLLPDTVEELGYKIANFQGLILVATDELQSLKDTLLEGQSRLKYLRKEQNDLINREGLLKAQENVYHDNLKSRYDSAMEISVKLGISFREDDYESVESSLANLVETHQSQLEKRRREARGEESAMEQKLRAISETKLKETQHKEYLLEDIKDSESQLEEIQSKIKGLTINEGNLEYEKTLLSDLESKLKLFRERHPVELLVNQIKDENIKVSAAEAEIESLSKDISQIHHQSESHAKVSLLLEEIKHKENVVSRLLENHKELLHEYEIDLEKPINSLNQLTSSKLSLFNNSNRDYTLLQKKLSELSSTVSYKKDTARQLKAESERTLAMIQGELEEGDQIDDYEEIIQGADDDYKLALENLKMRSTTLDFNRKALEFAENENNCYLCRRDFEKGPILTLFIKELKTKTSGENEKVLKQQLKDAKEYLDKIRSLAPDIKNVQATNLKLSTLVKELSIDEKKVNELQNLNDQAKVQVDNFKSELDALEALKNPINEITRIQNDVKSLRAQVEEKQQILASFGLPSNTLEELQDLQIDKTEQLKSLRKNINFLLEEKDFKQREHVILEGNVKDKRLNISNMERSLIERENMLDSARDLSSKISKLKEDIFKSDEIIEEVTSEYATLKSKLTQIALSNKESMEKEEISLSNERNLYNTFHGYNNQIKKFIDEDSEVLEKVRISIQDANESIGLLESDISSITEKISKQQSRLQDTSNEERNLKNNMDILHLQSELDALQRSIEETDVRKATESRNRYVEESEKLSVRHSKISAELAGKMGEMRQIDDQIRQLKKELETDYKDIKELYRKEWVKHQVKSIHYEDLNTYAKALDSAIMNYHSVKMKEINRIIDELWKTTYKGTDVDTIRIESEPNSTNRVNRSYNYRVVMVKQNVKLDMRGRCSAGQKVLASIIIRLALSECFGTNCGVIALDEPTTNLDSDNIESLAKSLSSIIELRRRQNNFQLIVITHDEKFLTAMQASKYTSHFYRIKRDQSQKSLIEWVDINKVVE